MDTVERFELVVSEEGILPIPVALRVALHLEPGEVVSVESGPAALSLETFSAFLDALAEAAPEKQWEQVVQRFLTRTLTCMEEEGLPIPSDLLPQRGRPVVLQVIRRGSQLELYLLQAEVSAVRQDLANEPEI
jgi:hypothetical protein